MITFDTENGLFHLQTRESSYVMQVLNNQQLVHRYFGKKISHFSTSNKITYLDRAFAPSPISGNRTFSLDVLPLEYSSNGLGDFRTASVELRNSFGVGLDLKYRTHRIYKGKPTLEGLPSSFGTDDEVETLELELYDQLTEITVTLLYSVFEEANVLARSAKITTGAHPTKIERCLSFTLDMPRKDFVVHSLMGRYGYEKEWTRTPLTSGRYEISSVRGGSGHSQTPFIALADESITEDSGEIYTAHLVYSGNFKAFAETSPLHHTRWGIGVNDTAFSWQLDAYQTFQTPEALLSYTDQGLTAMTHTSHAFLKHHLIKSPFVEKVRPILINNWEATYFDFTEEKILELAQLARQTGMELFVLDDGWFGHRDDDESSLGDWFVNRQKLPSGLKGLAQSINDLGLEFGLWFEPEMISMDSELYREHPDWAIQMAGREPIYSREQLVLDLSQDQVCDYVIDSVTSVLESANITYVKWDMNRNITNMPEGLANGERYEFHHRYMLGLYRILDTLTTRFPHILFESCSGGGGRNDLGMMYYMPQAWASDNTDAIGRLSIQEGTALIYPISSIGAHVSAIPNHQVGRETPLETRGNVAMMGGAFGYELDLTRLDAEEIQGISHQIATYKDIRKTIQTGHFYRLSKTDNTQAVMFVNEDSSQAVFTFIKILAQPEAPLIQVRLKGLDPDAQYHCPRLDETFYGDELMNVGLTMPHVQKDYFSVQYIFNKQ